MENILYYQNLSYISEIIYSKIISYQHDNLLTSYLGIGKTKELIGRKYFWPTFCQDIKAYVKGCNVCLTLKVVRHKSYKDLQLLPVPINYQKNLSIDFVAGLPLLVNWKSNSYNAILVIINYLINIVYYESVKTTIDIVGLAEVIIDVMVEHYGLSESIISNKDSLFNSKF